MQSKDRTYQVIAIVALVIGVCALTVGFAAFVQNLTINSSAEVKPASSVLDVVFSTSNTAVAPGSITPTTSGNTGVQGGTATLTNTTITGVAATFTEPGQKVTYEFNVYNNSAFTAYLTGVTFDNVSGQSAEKYCAPKTAETNPNPATVYTDACNGIVLRLYVGNTYSLVNGATTDVAGATINDTTGLATKTGYPAKVEIEYTGTATADGDFTVSFGDIHLSYSSVKVS